ncbi:hypothetical protein ACS0TY_027948 [Phlomoides rotata]
MADRIPKQIEHLSELVELNDINYFENLRVNRSTFNILCYLLCHSGGLAAGRYVTVSEQVALFLSVLSHHSKVRVLKFNFKRSGQTIQTYFHNVLRTVLKLHSILLATPVDDDCTHPRWKHFKGCLGTLDGTLIDVTVPEIDKARYCTRKGIVSVNVLATCDRQMRFIYLLTGWEGSAADARVLPDALYRDDGLKVPHGNFYLCDNGYPNGEGFLTPYKMVRYHLQEWGNGPTAPQNFKEYFNMNHSKARNIIERTFGLMKKRWAILRSPSFYPIKIQNRVILACALIHNFIRNEMSNDPLEEDQPPDTTNQTHEEEYIDSVHPSQEWSNWRDNLAHEIKMDGGTAEQVMTKLRNRNDKGHRGWSVKEEQMLAESMKKIVREGWKTENGFKTDYLNMLATYMKHVFPNTDLKHEPHITSRITVWKRNYHSLFEILKHTGVGLDSSTKMIEATDEQWTAFMTKDPNARLMRHKSWPLYEDWCEIFGQTRATSEGAESHARATTPPLSLSANIEVDNGSYKPVDENQDESQSPIGYAQTGESSEMGKTSSGRKRKMPITPDPMVNVVQKFCDNASSRLGEIAQRIGHEQDISAARKMIYSSVTEMNMFTLQEKLRATALIARNTEDIDVFFSLPETDRMEWVLMLLNGEI